MTSPHAAQAKRPAYSPPTINGDFYKIGNVLNERERALIKCVREFAEGVVAPVIEDYWARDAFPFEIVPKMAVECAEDHIKNSGDDGDPRRLEVKIPAPAVLIWHDIVVAGGNS